MKIAITGANSRVGINLIRHLLKQDDMEILAAGRSESALKAIPDHPRVTPLVVAYDKADQVLAAVKGADCVIHLAGILLQPRGTSYRQANLESTLVVADAAQLAGVGHFIFVSVLGADADSANAYFRSKGEAEQALQNYRMPVSVIRTPILLGPDTAAGRALLGAITRPTIKLLNGGRQMMSPLDIDDLNRAMEHLCQAAPAAYQLHELAGPERLSYRQLVEQAATLADKHPRYSSTPLWLARLGSTLLSAIKGSGMTPTVLEVITSDESLKENSASRLGIELTPLRDTLTKILNQEKH